MYSSTTLGLPPGAFQLAVIGNRLRDVIGLGNDLQRGFDAILFQPATLSLHIMFQVLAPGVPVLLKRSLDCYPGGLNVIQSTQAFAISRPLHQVWVLLCDSYHKRKTWNRSKQALNQLLDRHFGTFDQDAERALGRLECLPTTNGVFAQNRYRVGRVRLAANRE